jgi:hypothetical protein
MPHAERARCRDAVGEPIRSIAMNADERVDGRVDDLRPGDADLGSAPHGAADAVRHVHRERDYGVGYGNSSGYGSPLHFLDGHVDRMFRFRW